MSVLLRLLICCCVGVGWLEPSHNLNSPNPAVMSGFFCFTGLRDDLADVVRALVQAAKAGEPWAVRELLDRCIGKARPANDDTGEPLEAVVFNVSVPGVD